MPSRTKFSQNAPYRSAINRHSTFFITPNTDLAIAAIQPNGLDGRNGWGDKAGLAVNWG